MPAIFANKMLIDGEASSGKALAAAQQTGPYVPNGAPLNDSFNRTSSKMTITPPANEGTSQPPPIVGNPYKLESDPVYIAAMNAGQSQFNTARANALYSKNSAEADVAQQRKNLDVNATEARRRTAGNYAARGMMGGAAGAFSLAQAEANARQQTAQTSLADQITALNKNYLANYGNENQTDAAGNKNFDWTGTLIGQNYKTQAAQNALTAQLARMGVQ